MEIATKMILAKVNLFNQKDGIVFVGGSNLFLACAFSRINTYTFACRLSGSIATADNTNSRQNLPIQWKTVWLLKIFIATDKCNPNLPVQKREVPSAPIFIITRFQINFCKFENENKHRSSNKVWMKQMDASIIYGDTCVGTANRLSVL